MKSHNHCFLSNAYGVLGFYAAFATVLGCKAQAPAEVPKSVDRGRAVSEDAHVVEDFSKVLTGHRTLVYGGGLEEIRKRKVIRVIMRNNSTDYFLFRGDEVGFEYELALRFASELGVRLEIVVARARRDLIPLLLEGKGDIIAAGLSMTTARSKRVAFSRPYNTQHNVIVVRKGRTPPLTSPKDLLYEVVHVRRNSSYFRRLRQLGESLGQTIQIAAVPESTEVEDLLDQVARGTVPVTLARSNFVEAELTWRDDIVAAFALDGEDQIAWAMRPEDQQLKQEVDAFFTRHHKDVFFNSLYAKYFRNAKRAKILRDDDVRADRGGRISPYDELLREFGKAYVLDWRLLAAQMYQESRFDPTANSWVGAQGLMQLMPSTAAELGVTKIDDPRQNVEAGARYLRKLIDAFADELPLKERIRFSLAAYNVGRGHVDDARALARQLGYDANRWFGHTEKAMKLLSKPRYYQDAKHGYCRGEEPVHYVSQIQTRYDAYVMVAPAQ